MVKKISDDTESFGRIQTSFEPVLDNDVVNLEYLNENYTSALTWKTAVIDTLNDPPASPSEGDRYIIGTVPTGVWVGRANNIVEYESTGWNYEAPQEGWAVVDKNVDLIKVYDGSAWDTIEGVSNHNSLSNIQGGTTNEYYHLTNTENSAVTSMTNAGLQNLTSGEVDQLENIGTNTISNTQWGYLGSMNQGVATTDTPTFTSLNVVNGSATSILNSTSLQLGDALPQCVYDIRTGSCNLTFRQSDVSGNFSDRFEILNNGGIRSNGNIDLNGSGILTVSGTSVLDQNRSLSNILSITGTGNCSFTSGSVTGQSVIANSTLQTNGVLLKNSDTILTLSGDVQNITSLTTSGNINTTTGDYQVNGTTVINTSRNLTNIGTITTSGDITTTGGALLVGSGNAQTLLSSSQLRLGDAQQTARWSVATGGFDMNFDQDDGAGGLTSRVLFKNGGGIDIVNGSLQIGGTSTIDSSRNLLNVGSFTGSGNLNTTAGNYQINGTTVIDTSRNLTNIGTITASSDITTTSGLYVGSGNETSFLTSKRLRLGDGVQTARWALSTGSFLLSIDQDDGAGSFVTRTTIGSGGINIISGTLEMAGSAVIDASRNITCNDLTTTGTFSPSTVNATTYTVSGATLLHMTRDSVNGIVMKRTDDSASPPTSGWAVKPNGDYHIYGADSGGSVYSPMYLQLASGLVRYDTSSIKYKTDIMDINDRFNSSNIYKLEAKSYKRKDDGHIEFGFIAEDMYNNFPSVVTRGKENEIAGINYSYLTVPIVKEMQKLNNRVDELENENKELKTKIDEILYMLKYDNEKQELLKLLSS